MNRIAVAVIPTVVLVGSAAVLAAPFTYEPAGVLVPGSGSGLKTTKVYAPTMRYPILNAPSYPNSQVWGVGGSQGPKGSQCDAKNFSYPWHDNYCETRTWSMPLCPAGKGHQGQDIRGATCENKKHPTAATEDGTITSIGTYSVYLKGASGTTYRYLHMDPGTLKVKTGQKVSKGQQLGLVSNAFGGTPTSVHLHFDIEQYVSGVGTVFVSPYNSLVESYKKLIGPSDPCASKNCDDGKVCTKDACANGNCSHMPVAGPCDDGNACTLNDACQNGGCAAGGEKPCDDGKVCTTDSCAAGKCVFAENSKPCDDKNPCTLSDACAKGACQSGKTKDCADGITCTQDLCDKGACKNPPLPGTCDDGDPCTADTCGPTGCKHVGQGCDDGNPCTQDACAAGKCTHKATTGPCDDGDACTLGDACSNGGCAGSTKNCDDDNTCTADGCQGGACTNEAQSGACDDGDACTQGDYCALGLCLAGLANDCDDGLDCTVDSCADGQCAHAGDTQPVQTSCQGTGFVELYDACGAGPTLEECPADKPCGSGVCGGKPDPAPDTAAADLAPEIGNGRGGATDASVAGAADTPGAAGAGVQGGAADGAAAVGSANSAAVGAGSGCVATTRSSPDWLLVAGGVVVIWGVRRRRWSGSQIAPTIA